MVQYTDFRGSSLEKAVEHMNTVFDYSKATVISLKTKVSANVVTVRLWWMKK